MHDFLLFVLSLAMNYCLAVDKVGVVGGRTFHYIVS